MPIGRHQAIPVPSNAFLFYFLINGTMPNVVVLWVTPQPSNPG